MHHQRSEVDRRSVRVRLTSQGQEIRRVVTELFQRQAVGLDARGVMGLDGIDRFNSALKLMERYWADQIRYIY